MSEPTVPPPPSYTPPPPPPSGGSAPPGGASQNTLMLVLAYLGVLAVIPLVVEKDDREVQWHAKHGLVLLVAEIIVFAVLWILVQIPVLGCAFLFIWAAAAIGVLILHILCIVKAVNGQRFLIPYVSEYADRF